ncbi:hypothetical protein [Rossellomorea vietnamensis]|uniref:hypothetical protein n=1 Tax=Rossellomorea vietnamensis TaxID=218284 RepID=UPI000A54D3ED|nr:hypothetical protein [Rossellomorea vietnamensis]
MDEFEESVLRIMRRDEQWKEIFHFIVTLEEESPKREKLFRDYVANFIETTHSLDEE